MITKVKEMEQPHLFRQPHTQSEGGKRGKIVQQEIARNNQK